MSYFKNNEKHKEQINNIQLEIISKEIEYARQKIENRFLKEKDIYGNKKYYLHQYNKRIIKTPYGKISFKRAYIKDVNNNKYFYPLDQHLDIKKYSQFDRNVVSEIKELLKARVRISCISKILKIHKSTIHYIIKRFEKEFKNSPIMIDESKDLFINVDDTYNNFKVNKETKKKRIRLVAMHQGKDENNKLINLKTFVYFPDEHKIEQSIFINSLVKNHYKGTPKNIFFCSDGAREFKAISKENGFLKSLDQWHVLHKLNLVLPPKIKNFNGLSCDTRKILREKLKNLLKKSRVEKAISMLKNLSIKHKFNNVFSKTINSFIRYLKYNIDAIKIWKKHNVWTTTECFIFHKIKSFLGNKNKIFSIDIFRKIAGLHTNFL